MGELAGWAEKGAAVSVGGLGDVVLEPEALALLVLLGGGFFWLLDWVVLVVLGRVFLVLGVTVGWLAFPWDVKLAFPRDVNLVGLGLGGSGLVGLARFGLTKGVARVLVLRWMGGGCLDPDGFDGEREGNWMVSWRLNSTLRLSGERGLSVGPSSPGAMAGGDLPNFSGASRLEAHWQPTMTLQRPVPA